MISKLLALSHPPGRRRLRALIVAVVVAAVLQGAAFVALVPFLTALVTGDTGTATRWLLVLVGLAGLYAVAFWIGSQLGQSSSTEVLAMLLDRLGDRLVKLPVGYFAVDRAGAAADTATRGIVFAASAPYAILRPILTAFLTPATVLVGALFIDWRIAAAMALSAPLIWYGYRWISRAMTTADRVHAAAIADASARVIEYARVQPALRSAGDNSIGQRLVNDALRGQHAANRSLLVTGGTGIGVFSGIVQLALTAVIILGTYLVLGGELAAATLIALLVLAVRFTEPIIHSGALGGGVSVATNAIDRVQALLDEPTLPEPERPAAPRGWGIRFTGVSFGYGGEPVLRELSFDLPAGTMTAVVGPSGSGKTTIIRLIARFYDPENGSVQIGDVSLPELGTEQVTRAVAPVFQDVYLFDGSVIDNIWIGDPDATREQVVRAAAQARVDEIVARLPGGWDAPVGEGGTNLSGGERQRVSIARALLKDAPIVLLDEATAALDVGNESVIQEAFAAIRAGRTLVVVAHRLSTITTADHIIMLDGQGGIAEQGTHDALLAAGGDYARYWSERVDAAGWRLTPARSG